MPPNSEDGHPIMKHETCHLEMKHETYHPLITNITL